MNAAAVKKKILLVDDHPAYSSVLAASLRTQGFDVLSTDDTEKALGLAETEKPNLILLDIMMPQMGGTEVRAELLKRPATKEIPVIFLTGLRQPRFAATRPKDAAPARPATVRTIGKSDDLKELLEAIREALIAKN